MRSVLDLSRELYSLLQKLAFGNQGQRSLIEDSKPSSAAVQCVFVRQPVLDLFCPQTTRDGAGDLQADQCRGKQLVRPLLQGQGSLSPLLRQQPFGRDISVQDDHPRPSRASRMSLALSENTPYFLSRACKSALSSAPTSCLRRNAASVSACRSSPSRLCPCCLAWERNHPTTQSSILRTRISAIPTHPFMYISPDRSTVT